MNFSVHFFPVYPNNATEIFSFPVRVFPHHLAVVGFPKDAQVYLLWSWQKVIQKIKYNKIKGQAVSYVGRSGCCCCIGGQVLYRQYLKATHVLSSVERVCIIYMPSFTCFWLNYFPGPKHVLLWATRPSGQPFGP